MVGHGNHLLDLDFKVAVDFVKGGADHRKKGTTTLFFAVDRDGRIGDEEPFIFCAHVGRVSGRIDQTGDNETLASETGGSRVTHLGGRAQALKIKPWRHNLIEFCTREYRHRILGGHEGLQAPNNRQQH